MPQKLSSRSSVPLVEGRQRNQDLFLLQKGGCGVAGNTGAENYDSRNKGTSFLEPPQLLRTPSLRRIDIIGHQFVNAD